MSKKRVVFCTNPSLSSSLVLQKLLESDRIQVVGVFLSDRIRTKSGSFIGDVFRIIKTSGIRYACYLALGTLVFDLFRLPGMHPRIQRIAKSQHIPLFSSKDINSDPSLNWLQDLRPDIIFSGFFNQKLGVQCLSLPSIGALNIHPALLPEYKGVDPVFYYFLNGETSLGISLHRMDQDYDTGEILNTQQLQIRADRSVFWHTIELFKYGAALFLQWVEQPGSLESPIKNTEKTDSYDSWPTASQVRRLDTPLFHWQDFLDQAKKSESKPD